MKKKIVWFLCCFILLVSCKKDDAISTDPPINPNPSPINDGRTPCINGFAGEYPCNNYDLMGLLTPADMGAERASDLWGWTDNTTGKEYALICLDTGLAFVDISDPINPIYLGTLASAIGGNYDSPRDVKVYKDHAFMMAQLIGHGLQIFDLTKLRNVDNPPQSFEADVYYTGFVNSHNLVINEETGILCAVGSESQLTPSIDNPIVKGPFFTNIQDPKNPIAIGDFHSYTSPINPLITHVSHHDAQVVTYKGPDTDYTGKEIYFGLNLSGDNLEILDVTDTFNPEVISYGEYDNTSIPHQGWLTEDHRYFLLGDEGDESRFGYNSRTIVFDLLDLDNPKKLYDYFGPTPAIDHNGYAKGNTFYLANYEAGLRVIDITNIENNMTEIGYFDTHPQSDNASFEGAWSVYPYFNSGNLIVSDRENGLFIVKKNN